jgi:GNAT superfamily N-acetyltransferase
MTRSADVQIRPLRCRDEPAVRRFLAGLTPESRYRRFHAPVHAVPEPFFARLFAPVHPVTTACVAATAAGSVVGLSQLVPGRRVPGSGPPAADLAVVVAESFRRRGLARRLVAALSVYARPELAGWRLRAEVQADNAPALALARLLAPGARRGRDGTDVVFELDVPRWAEVRGDDRWPAVLSR